MYTIKVKDFNLSYTLSCGQVFNWEYVGWWRGWINNTQILVKQVGDSLHIDSNLSKGEVERYFRLDDDLEKICLEINRDYFISKLIKKYWGLRLIRQDPWECLVSYLCSSNNTIENIRNTIKNLRRKYGSFPSPGALAKATIEELKQCKLGFRALSVREAARRIDEGEFDLYDLKRLDYLEARRELMSLLGVGPKIADCILLFSLDRMEAFPVDTHIERIMRQEYMGYLSPRSSRERIWMFGRKYFGRYCGYAQEYLYYEALNRKADEAKKKLGEGYGRAKD